MEDLFNQDITVINKYIDKESKSTKYKISYVKGFWSSNNGVSISGMQLIKADGLSARILIKDSRNEEYQEPKEFQKEPKKWTLQTDDYLIKGKVENFTTITKLLEDYSEVIKVTNIGIKDYGSQDMQHFAITGA